MHPRSVDTPDGSSGLWCRGLGHERLDLHHDRPPPFDGREHHRSGDVGLPFGQERFRGVGHFGHALRQHLEESDHMSRSETILEAAKRSKASIGISLE